MRIRDFPQLALSRSKGYATDGNNYSARSLFGILFDFDYDILFECLENFSYGRKLNILGVILNAGYRTVSFALSWAERTIPTKGLCAYDNRNLHSSTSQGTLKAPRR